MLQRYVQITAFFLSCHNFYFLQALQAWREEEDSVAVGDTTSHRLALCNMDWDHLSARDIFGEFVVSRSSMRFLVNILTRHKILYEMIKQRTTYLVRQKINYKIFSHTVLMVQTTDKNLKV